MLTAPVRNFLIRHDFTRRDRGEFAVKFYRSISKEEKKNLFEELELLMKCIDPPITKKHRPKGAIEEDISILQNFEEMKATGNYRTINNKNGKLLPFENAKIAKDRNEKIYQRRMKEIEERIGWDTKSSN